MAAKKTRTVAEAVQQTLPGWKIVRQDRVADAAKQALASDAVSVSPGLAAQRAKYFGVTTPARKRSGTAKADHAEFVTVAPASQPDNLGKFHKVVLVKNGKVIAQQG